MKKYISQQNTWVFLLLRPYILKLNPIEKYVFDLNLELKPSQAKLDFFNAWLTH